MRAGGRLSPLDCAGPAWTSGLRVARRADESTARSVTIVAYRLYMHPCMCTMHITSGHTPVVAAVFSGGARREPRGPAPGGCMSHLETPQTRARTLTQQGHAAHSRQHTSPVFSYFVEVYKRM